MKKKDQEEIAKLYLENSRYREDDPRYEIEADIDDHLEDKFTKNDGKFIDDDQYDMDEDYMGDIEGQKSWNEFLASKDGQRYLAQGRKVSNIFSKIQNILRTPEQHRNLSELDKLNSLYRQAMETQLELDRSSKF